VNDFASAHFGGCDAQLLEDRLKGIQAIVRNASYDETELKLTEIVLSFQLAVNCYEYVEPILSEVEE
jgi:hypothetical protein